MDFVKAFINMFLPSLSKESLEKFRELVSVNEHKKGHIIVNEGETPTQFYILKKGIVRSFILNDKGKEHIRTLYIPVTTSGALSSLIKKTPSNATYECLTDCEILEGNFSDFIKLTKEYHDLSLFYNKVLESIFQRTENKVFDLSVLNAKERYLKLKKEVPNIDNLITQYHIAAYLNITPVQLSRIRKDLYSK
ncbi:MAG: Crp/Fnr family transcriptional regulator [Flavobacteriaceae bacterium]